MNTFMSDLLRSHSIKSLCECDRKDGLEECCVHSADCSVDSKITIHLVNDNARRHSSPAKLESVSMPCMRTTAPLDMDPQNCQNLTFEPRNEADETETPPVSSISCEVSICSSSSASTMEAEPPTLSLDSNESSNSNT